MFYWALKHSCLKLQRVSCSVSIPIPIQISVPFSVPICVPIYILTHKKNPSFFYQRIQNIHNINNIKNIHNIKNKKNEDFYFDYDEDQKILERIQNDEMENVLDITDEKNFLKIKKKYLKLLKKYHPDAYLNEQNEFRKKNKEEIFRQIYKRYKAINKENIESYESDESYESEFENYDNVYNNVYDNDRDRIYESTYEEEDDRKERMERYKRYAEGKRTDISNINVEAYTLASICVVFVGVFFLCLYLPFNVKPDKEEFYEYDEKRKIEIVSCFYNPVLQRYEYFPKTFSPPLPDQLYYFYKTNFPNLPIDENILKINRFEIIKLPKNKAKKARLVYDNTHNELIYIKRKKIKET